MRITTCSVPTVERGERKKERRGREKRKKKRKENIHPRGISRREGRIVEQFPFDFTPPLSTLAKISLRQMRERRISQCVLTQIEGGGRVAATYVADASRAPRQKEENIGGVKLGRRESGVRDRA